MAAGHGGRVRAAQPRRLVGARGRYFSAAATAVTAALATGGEDVWTDPPDAVGSAYAAADAVIYVDSSDDEAAPSSAASPTTAAVAPFAPAAPGPSTEAPWPAHPKEEEVVDLLSGSEAAPSGSDTDDLVEHDAADFRLTVTLTKRHLDVPAGVPFTILSGDGGFEEVASALRDRRAVRLFNPHPPRSQADVLAFLNGL
ncbi:hypothetical protein I4F81_000819 [Pyropia yezoensis]|uniref:Uncharacterized protein n=1 Tax=Pyropia yezoensis TaxID=2788 RepID=A0ACC3BKR0_PYRYE|nr:hypothetical protein I4F81_000819 [Neopyropia yezoensis]